MKINLTPLSQCALIYGLCYLCAVDEGGLADGGHRVWNGNGAQATATTESIFANGGDGIGGTLIGDTTGNNQCTGQIAIRWITKITLVRDLRITTDNVVVQRISVVGVAEIVGKDALRNCQGHQQDGQKE